MKTNRILAMCLAVLLCLSCLMASGLAESKLNYPLQGDDLTVSIATNANGNITAVCEWIDTPFMKAYQEATGVKVEVVHPSDFGLLFASNNLPDIIYYRWSDYPGGAPQAIKDGIIIPIEDYLPDAAPDYYETLTSNPDWYKQALTTDGHLYGVNFIRTADRLTTSVGMMVRYDWLKDLNMEMPETPEEFKAMLIAFRDQKGATVPFSVNYWRLYAQCLELGLITSPFGLVRCGYYQKDGTVYNGYYSQELKDCLEWLHELYAEGLLDNSMATVDDTTLNANILNGLSGVLSGSPGSGIGVYMQTMADKDPHFEVTGMGSLVAKKGDRAMSGHIDNALTGFAAAISANCKNVELALNFLNWTFTEEGMLRCAYGEKGVSYTLVDGVPTYTELLTKNPDGLTQLQAMLQYSMAGAASLPYPQPENYIDQYYQWPQQRLAMQNWTNNDAKLYRLPPLTIAEEDQEEFAEITSELNTYIQETVLAFINGQKPLDEYDQYLSTLKAMGMEQAIAMQQNALDLYNAR